jgi:hypothetical protein
MPEPQKYLVTIEVTDNNGPHPPLTKDAVENMFLTVDNPAGITFRVVGVRDLSEGGL